MVSETMDKNQESSKKTVSEDDQIVAGVLALLLGGIGVHKFYLGRMKQGLLFLLLSWTFIPGIIAFIEGILILSKGEQLV